MRSEIAFRSAAVSFGFFAGVADLAGPSFAAVASALSAAALLGFCLGAGVTSAGALFGLRQPKEQPCAPKRLE